MAGKLVLSVTQLNEYVRRLLQQDPLLHEIELKGEISNLKHHQTGMLFFTLKDEQASISCVMSASDVYSLEFEPFDGMRAVITGSVALYTRGGQYQFYVRQIRAQGLGVLYERFQMLKEKLEREGLFDPASKRPIPSYIDTMGVVSSPTGAVIHDIMNVSFRRDEHARILLCPVRVQGPEAPDEVVEAIRLLDAMDAVSVIVLARGGGSIEDLWTFNEERVVRAVYACKKPVVSAIGHETDFTLCDFAADLRAPTPSAAAECVIPLRSMQTAQLRQMKSDLMRWAGEALRDAQVQLNLRNMQLAALHPSVRVEAEMDRLAAIKKQLSRLACEDMKRRAEQIEGKKNELELLSPYRVLSRGYALVRREGVLMTDAAGIAAGDSLELLMRDGVVSAVAIEPIATHTLNEGE